MDIRESIVEMVNGITDGNARWTKTNCALVVAYNALGNVRTKIATSVLTRSLANQPKKKPSKDQEDDINTFLYLKFGRYATCFEVMDIVADVYMTEELQGKDSNVERYLKQLCDQMILHRFVVKDKRTSAKAYTYNRHLVQWFTQVVLPCTIKCLADTSAYKHACYVIAAYMLTHASREDKDWSTINKGVERAKKEYCDEFLWSLISKAHPDIKVLIPRYRDSNLVPDDYVKMVFNQVSKFDLYYGVDIDESFVKGMLLPASIKTPMLLAVTGNISEDNRSEFLRSYFVRFPELGVKITPEFAWNGKNSGVKITPENSNSGVKITPEIGKKVISGVKITPECSSLTGDNIMQDKNLSICENGPLRVNLTSLREELLEEASSRSEDEQEGGVVIMADHDNAEEDNTENEEDIHGSYNGDMLQDQSITETQKDDQSFTIPEFIPRGKKKKIVQPKAKTESFPGQASLHRREIKKKKDKQKPTPTVLNDPSKFISTYRRIVSEETGGRSTFPKPEMMGIEVDSAKRMLDKLRNNGCFDEGTLMGWMRYSGGQFKKIRRTITVGMMKDTWTGYRKFKPTGTATTVSIAGVPPSGYDSIGLSMAMFFSSGSHQDAIWAACKSWGLVLTAHWLSTSSKDPCAEVRDCLVAKLGTEVGNGDVKGIIATTMRWEPETSKYGLTMADWKQRLADVMAKVGEPHPFPSKRDDVEDVLTFVGNMRRNPST